MADMTTQEQPVVLSEFDFWELECFHQKAGSDGWLYAVENYPPRFEYAGYEPVDRDTLRALWRRYRPEVERRWAEDGDAACAAHNAHVDEARQRADYRALWAVRFTNGNVAAVGDETHARFMHREPSWNVDALLTRDEPGGQWREVTEQSNDENGVI